MVAKRLRSGTLAKRRTRRRRREGLQAGMELKEEGMDQAAAPNQEWLEWARGVAFDLVFEKGKREGDWEIFIDEVRAIVEDEGYFPTVPQAWGSIWRNGMYEQTGEWRRSAHPANHAHSYPVWQLKKEYRRR